MEIQVKISKKVLEINTLTYLLTYLITYLLNYLILKVHPEHENRVY